MKINEYKHKKKQNHESLIYGQNLCFLILILMRISILMQIAILMENLMEMKIFLLDYYLIIMQFQHLCNNQLIIQQKYY